VRCRSLLLTAPRTLEWVDEELQPLAPHEILVRTTSGAISLGTELSRYRGSGRSELSTYPLMTGYENVGVIIECGSEVEGFDEGDRVLGTYGHRTHAILDARRAIPVPDAIFDPIAILAILSCDVEKGLRRIAPQPSESALITGAGTMGLLAVFMLRARGLTRIDVVDPLYERRAAAIKLGARHALSPDEAYVSEEQYTIGVECSDQDVGFHLLQTKLDRYGRICVLADGNLEPFTLLPEFHSKELMTFGSSDGWDYPAHAAWYFDYVRRTQPPLDALFDVRITPDQLPETFAALVDIGTLSAIKVLVDYAES